jgi:quinol-cytochrome oxidoreductase complex cytochrome b subunit
VGINLNATAPFLGPFLSDFLRGGQEIGTETLARFYSMHMLLIPGGLIGLLLLHLYLVVRLGVTSPPWSKDAAGRDREEVITGRRGLLEPRPRGDGGSPAGVKGRPEA